MNNTVGFIGLGNMGSRMAKRLVAAGYRVIGYDLRPGLAEQLGLIPAASPAETCEADVVLMSLPDSRVIEQVVLGPNGIKGAAKPGRTIVDLSTAEPASTRKLYNLLLEDGVDYLDAAVSGGPAGAASGTLTIMAGGQAEVLERVRAVLEVIGKRVFYMGAPGNGHATKAVNNFLNGMNLAATSEAMVVAVKAGLDPRLLLEVLNTSSGKNNATEMRFPKIVEGDYIEGGLSNTLMAKDLDVYNALARQVKATSMLGEACRSVFSIAIATGYADRVSNSVVDVLGNLAGGTRVQPAKAGEKTED